MRRDFLPIIKKKTKPKREQLPLPKPPPLGKAPASAITVRIWDIVARLKYIGHLYMDAYST